MGFRPIISHNIPYIYIYNSLYYIIGPRGYSRYNWGYNPFTKWGPQPEVNGTGVIQGGAPSR